MVRAPRPPPGAAPALALALTVLGVLVGTATGTRDQHLQPEGATLTPPVVSTDGWRPMPPPQGWPDAIKSRSSTSPPPPPAPAPSAFSQEAPPSSFSSSSSAEDASAGGGGYSQESVGHPVLSKLQQHLESAEKKRVVIPLAGVAQGPLLLPKGPVPLTGQRLRAAAAHAHAGKADVYAPAPPSILGSFSVFGHATLKARDKTKKKKPVDGLFQGSETRSPFAAHLVQGHFPRGHFPQQHFPRGGGGGGARFGPGGGDLRPEQQQHTRYFLQPPPAHAHAHTPFGTDTLLVPPQPQDGSLFFAPNGGIASFQQQKLGDFDSAFLDAQAFPPQYPDAQAYNPGVPESGAPSQFQQPQYPPTNIEFLPDPGSPATFPPAPERERDRPQGILTNPTFHAHLDDGSGGKPRTKPHKPQHHDADEYAPAEVHVTPQKQQQQHASSTFPLGDGQRPVDDSLILTPTPPRPDDAQQHESRPSAGAGAGGSYAGFPGYAPAAPVPPSRTIATHSHPNGATSVVAFSLGSVGNAGPSAAQLLGGPLVLGAHGERGRITRPFYQEAAAAPAPPPRAHPLQSDEEQESDEGEEGEDTRPEAYTPPTAPAPSAPQRERPEPFLPTLSPAARPYLSEPPPSAFGGATLAPPPPATNEVPQQDIALGPLVFPRAPEDEEEQEEQQLEEEDEGLGATPAAPPTAAAPAPSAPDTTEGGAPDPTHETTHATRFQKPRTRRPGGGYRPRPPTAASAPAATEAEPTQAVEDEEEPSRAPPRYRRPGSGRRPPPYYRRRPAQPQDDVNEVHEARPYRRPGQRRPRPPAHAYADDGPTRDNQDYYQPSQYGDSDAGAAPRPYRRRRPSTTAPSQHLDDTEQETEQADTSSPSAAGGDTASPTLIAPTDVYPTATPAPLTTTTARPRRRPPYNRGKEKYGPRQPLVSRSTTTTTTTTTTTPAPVADSTEAAFEASVQVDEYVNQHNEVLDVPAVQPEHPNHKPESYETEEVFTTPIPTTSTTAATTTTTTTTTTTPPPPTTTTASTTTSTTPAPATDPPHTTEEAAASTTVIARLRPRLRFNATRPRFSVRDYRERLNRTPAPAVTTTSSTTTTTEDPFEALRGNYESTRTKPELEGSATPPSASAPGGGQRVRYPARNRGSYQYKRTEEEAAVGAETTTTEAPPQRSRNPAPKDKPRYGSGARYRSSTTTTTTPAPAPEAPADKSKPSTSRYRPGTGKYYSRYRATSEAPSPLSDDASAPGASASAAAASAASAASAAGASGAPATARPTVRPKGVFSAARRPYPHQLRPPRPAAHRPSSSTAPAAQEDSNRLEEQRDSDDAGSHAAPAAALLPTSPSAHDHDAPPPHLFTRKPEENAIEASTLLKKVDNAEEETVSPAPASAAPTRRRTTTTSTSAPPPSNHKNSAEETKSSSEEEEGTRTASQRVAALTSAAAFAGGIFKTPASSPFDARRITMATEDPILPIEAFFPMGIWNHSKDDKSR